LNVYVVSKGGALNPNEENLEEELFRPRFCTMFYAYPFLGGTVILIWTLDWAVAETGTLRYLHNLRLEDELLRMLINPVV
jgi:hypothetical protein